MHATLVQHGASQQHVLLGMPVRNTLVARQTYNMSARPAESDVTDRLYRQRCTGSLSDASTAPACVEAATA